MAYDLCPNCRSPWYSGHACQDPWTELSNSIAIETELRARIEELEAAIRKHRDQTGHDLCWENDEELWRVLGDDVQIDHTPPPWPEFMTRCAAYRASKDGYKPGGRTNADSE